MSENYLMLNGKRVDLTDEQIEKLGLKTEKDCFSNNNYDYCFIDDCGVICRARKGNVINDMGRHEVANYCADESLLQQRAFHEALNRLLWRFSMQNDGDKIDWRDIEQIKYYVYYDNRYKTFNVSGYYYLQPLMTVFYSENIAKRAIDEIIKPFMKEHPEFVW